MDKDLLNQYKYMDSPNVSNPKDTRENQQIARNQANFLFNFLTSD